MKPLRLSGALCALALLAVPTGADGRAPAPHWESLKFDEVNGRAGPSFDHPVVWRYQREGLPVEVIAHSADWRRIRDPDGDEVWVHQRTLSSSPHVIVHPDDGSVAPLRRARGADARIVADVERGVVFTLEQCEGAWRRVSGPARGWMRAEDLWGVDCRRADETA